MKYILLVSLLFFTLTIQAQAIKPLKEVSKNDTISVNNALIYGNFIQRLKFTSGGFPQDVRIQDTLTKQYFSFRVKPTFKSAKENNFCFFIPPGTYVLVNYWYTESKWYGGKTFTEPVRSKEASPYLFTIQSNTLNYLGDWHFETKEIIFTDNKTLCDNKLKSYHLNFAAAVTILPYTIK